MTVKEYFERYITLDTTSVPGAESYPSSDNQLMLAMVLQGDLLDMGVQAQMDEYGYVYAQIPASAGLEDAPKIGFIAHMDTSCAASGKNIAFKTVKYDGSPILLNEELGITMSAEQFPCLNELVGQELIVTDGTTLLGADDKAGIAEIMALCERIVNSSEPHCAIRVAFTPDEEIGLGTEHFDLERFDADFAYTIDGGELGELQFENFNAASAFLKLFGTSAHTGTAKGAMVNAGALAAEFAMLLPQDETPEQTEGYEGFYHLDTLEGKCELASMHYLIRDHDRASFEKRKEHFAACVAELERRHPKLRTSLEIRDTYANMREYLKDSMFVVERAKDAMQRLDIEPIIRPIRGGTDGARLSEMGLPCPNISTGGYNFHSRYEFIVVSSMYKMTDLLFELVSCQ